MEHNSLGSLSFCILHSRGGWRQSATRGLGDLSCAWQEPFNSPIGGGSRLFAIAGTKAIARLGNESENPVLRRGLGARGSGCPPHGAVSLAVQRKDAAQAESRLHSRDTQPRHFVKLFSRTLWLPGSPEKYVNSWRAAQVFESIASDFHRCYYYLT